MGAAESGLRPKSQENGAFSFSVPTDLHVAKYGLGHRGRTQQASDVDHELGVGEETLDVFTGVAGPVFQVVETAGRVEADTLSVAEPARATLALEGQHRGSRSIFRQKSARP